MIIELTDSGKIHGMREEAFQCFWRAELWPQLTSHVTRVEMLEDNDCWQRYALHVRVDGKDYVMETQRIAVPGHFISFYQPKPPYFMHAHSGVWRFEENELGETQVTVTHRVVADDHKTMEALGMGTVELARRQLMQNLHKNGMAMINSVDAFLEQKGDRNMLLTASR